jgi:hypothetical protein
MEKARIAKVKFAADLEIECLMLPDGSFGIGVSQIASVFSLDKTIATREVKTLLGKDISLDKTTSELNSKAVNYNPKFTRWLKQDGVAGAEYGVRCNELKRKMGLPLLPIDDYDKDELTKMNLAEAMYDRLRCKGLSHEDAFDLI